jgi:hypothetical protein
MTFSENNTLGYVMRTSLVLSLAKFGSVVNDFTHTLYIYIFFFYTHYIYIYFYTHYIFFFTHIICIYCNKFAGSVSRWKFITLKVQYTTLDYSSQLFYNSNTRITSTSSLTQLLITVHDSSRNLTHVRQILELQRMRVISSSFSPL